MKTKQLKLNDPLTGKLLTYSAAAGALLAFGQKADAQITYTDVDPDQTLVGEYGEKGIYELDINNDGTIDLLIIQGNEDWYSGWQSVRVMPQNQGAVVTSAIYFSAWEKSYYMGLKFDKDAAIGVEANFNSSTVYSVQMAWAGTSSEVAYTSGPWVGEVDKYLGVRISLDEGSTFNYGWVRLDVAEDLTSFTVKDYAYEATAGTAIAAGDEGGTQVEDDFANDLGVKIFSFENSIILADVDTDNAQADIFNTIGQLVHSTPVHSGRIEIQKENKGLYIVKLKLNEDIVTSKVIVK